MPSWLSDLVGTDMAPLAYYALVAAIVLVLILVVLTIAKKAMGAGGGQRAKNRGPRLAVLDISVIDQKRKLVLVRRDEVEHLLLIGGQNDLVVEASIVKMAANGRQGRTDPSLGVESDLGQAGLRGAVPVRGTAAARGPSPLTRPVPRPAHPSGASAAPVVAVPPVGSPATVSPAIEDPSNIAMEANRSGPAAPVVAPPVATLAVAAAPVVAPPVVAPPQEVLQVSAPSKGNVKADRDTDAEAKPSAPPAPSIPAVEPPTQTVAQRQAAPSVQAPIVSPTASAVPAPSAPAPVVSVRPKAPPAVETPKAEAPKVSVPVPATMPSRAPAPSPVAPAPAPPVTPPFVASPSVAASAPGPAAASGSSAPVVPQQPPRAAPIPPSAMPRPVSREPERSPQIFTPSDTDALKSASAAILPTTTRFSVGGSFEPIQRSGQPVPLPQGPTRSMATPTLPLKPTPAAAELEAKANRPQSDRPIDAGDDVKAPKTMAVEPSPEEVLARLLAKAKEPVRSTSLTGETSQAPRERTPVSTPPVSAAAPAQPSGAQTRADAAPISSDVVAPEAGERRPLSVRSFASTIQGQDRQLSPAPIAAPVPTRREPEVVVPPVPAAALPPVSAPAPVAPPRELPAPVAAPAAPNRQPVTAWEDEENDLEDFLSAQLNDQLGEDIWTTKDVAARPAAPVVAPEKPIADTQTIDQTAEKPSPAKRPLTLEEEMERLLGDFDLDTSDRRTR